MAAKNKSIKVEGIVMPAEWDENGRVIEVKISAAGELDYLVSGTKKGRCLLFHLKARIWAEGDLSQNKRGENVIVIRSYRFNQQPIEGGYNA